MKKISALAVLLVSVAGSVLVGSTASAAVVAIELCATTGTVTIPGEAAPVPIWGFGIPSTPGNCATATASLPGPRLVVNVGDAVTLTVRNNLPPGTGNVTHALRFELPGMSFAAGPVDAAVGSAVTIGFTAAAPGTYQYQSGGDAGRQEAMGLSGMFVVRPPVPGQAYGPGTAFDVEANLVLDAVDPAFNNAPDTFDLHAYRATSWLINGSYRTSNRRDKSVNFAPAGAASTSQGSDIRQKIGILETSWVINSSSLVTAKYNDFKYLTQSRPDFVADVTALTTLGTQLDINNLDKLGQVSVPIANSSNAAVNAFRQTYINKYGYPTNGVQTGGGNVGFATTFDNDDFFRRSGQIGYNLTLGSMIGHDIHAGYQRFKDSENLARGTNGWGSITIPGGSTNCPATTACSGKPIFFTAAFQQQSIGIPPIHSEIVSDNIELNDTIHWRDWTFNAGVLASHDTLFGQGLRKADNLAGFVAAVGSKYEMYDVPYKKMIQPRLGATWSYNGSDTVYTSLAIYNPSTTSLPRAASWDRNLRATVTGYFDANGVLMGVDPVASSSGKLFVQDMKPRTVREYLLGTSQQITSRWSTRLYGRYRHTDHFWEDTNNNARLCFLNIVNGACSVNSIPSDAPSDVPHQQYVPDLQARRVAIGGGSASGSTYVIAELDGAFTKYYEATTESEWRGDKAFVRGTYTWSHYYGNFDQDGSSGCTSPPSDSGPCDDQNTFIGSSNIGDAAGRQLWNFKYGNLHGDRRNILKVYGAYTLPWHASAGAYGIFQSGQPWEAWNYEIYKPQVGASTSDTIRYAEPAGSRRTPSHHQLDLNYIQRITLPRSLGLELQADVFNVFDKQTARKYQPSLHSAFFAQPNLFYAPRRYQLAARILF